MRNANGFGNVSKLSGKRRNPWRARITTGWVMDEATRKAKQRVSYVCHIEALSEKRKKQQ